MKKSFHVLLQYLLPLQLISRITWLLMHSRVFPFRDAYLRFMIEKHHVDISEADNPDYTDHEAYPTINSFFVRALRPGARPVDPDNAAICSPADGTISQFGNIDDDRLFQAKGHWFSLQALLGGSAEWSNTFRNGKFMTIYLSPQDYHRVHIPYSGSLREMIHVPGTLFSVAPDFIEQVPGLFARNERVVSIFDTTLGPMAVILVGAINVGSIETVWHGPVSPPRARRTTTTHYPQADGQAIQLQKGDELGRFNLGSTVILLFPQNNIRWDDYLNADDKVKMGQTLATRTDP